MVQSKLYNLNGREYIELNKLLKFMGLVETGGEANERIVNGEVIVNGQIEIQKRKKLRAGDEVNYQQHKVSVLP